MKRFSILWLLIYCLCCTVTLQAQDVYVYFKGGGLNVYPSTIVKSTEQTDTQVNIVLVNDSLISFSLDEVLKMANDAPTPMPRITSFKFNNKYNDQVFTDVIATIGDDDVITATVGAIGKRLTPSFKVDSAEAKVWVNGIEQQSKESRNRFDGDVVYTVGYDNWKQLSYRKVRDEVWSTPEAGAELRRLSLDANMFSTNAPSNYGEDLEDMLDGDIETFFHSTWGNNGPYSKLPEDVCPYIDISLAEDIQNFRFGYITRSSGIERTPLSFVVYTSSDGVQWQPVRELTTDDGIPSGGMGLTYESPTITLDAPTRYLRLEMTSANYKNYLVLAEFWIDEVLYEWEAGEPELLSPAQYAYKMIPYGRDMIVRVSWPTDTAAVPRVYIDVEGGILPPDKVNYLNATIRIDGAGVYPDMEESVLIRGRGNSSWAGQYGKSPYRLKFSSSKKPFGLTKGKSWVLLANKQTGSMLSNAVAMKVASMVQTAGSNRIIPIELYMNGEYRGSYQFTQQVGLSNNSIDLEDETNAALLELDSYYDEDYRFRSSNYNLPVNVKDPDLVDYTDPDSQFQLIQDDFNHFETILANGTDDYTQLVDVEMLARFLLVNELVLNLELHHPKSTFLYKEDMMALHSRYVFGPAWDFDWAFGYELNYKYCVDNATADYFGKLLQKGGLGASFFNDLRYNSDVVKRTYYAKWKAFMEKYKDELIEYVEDYFQYVNPSFLHNAEKWSGEGSNYETVKNNTRDWLENRVNYIYENCIEPYDLSSPLPIMKGDVNLDGYITVADVVCILNYMLALPNDEFDFTQADIDETGEVSINDVVCCVALVMNQPLDALYGAPMLSAEAALRVQSFEAQLGEVCEALLTLSTNTNDYKALQFDVVLPKYMTVSYAQPGEGLQGFQVSTQQLNDSVCRLLIIPNANEKFNVGKYQIALHLACDGLVAECERVLSTQGVVITSALGEDYRVAPHSSRFDYAPTSIVHLSEQTFVEGGDKLIIEVAGRTTIMVYTLDGRMVYRATLDAGKHSIDLPAGVYVVDGKKVIIK